MILSQCSGDSISSLQYAFRIPKNTIYTFLPGVIYAIYEVMRPYMTVPRTERDWNGIKKTFEERWNFPICCGAIDCKHVRIRRPAASGSELFCYKGIYSIILFAVVDGNHCFLCTDAGCNGKTNDGCVFRNSAFNIAMQRNQLNLPKDCLFVGDDAFPLRRYLLKPYVNNNLTIKQKIFNYRLSRVRRIAENACGILASRFRIFERPIGHRPDTVEQSNRRTVFSLGSNSHSKGAGQLRDEYADYFFEKDPLPWQQKLVGTE